MSCYSYDVLLIVFLQVALIIAASSFTLGIAITCLQRRKRRCAFANASATETDKAYQGANEKLKKIKVSPLAIPKESRPKPTKAKRQTSRAASQFSRVVTVVRSQSVPKVNLLATALGVAGDGAQMQQGVVFIENPEKDESGSLSSPGGVYEFDEIEDYNNVFVCAV